MPLNKPSPNPLRPAKTPKFIVLGEDDADDEEILKEVFTTVDDSFELEFINNGRKLIASLEQLDDLKLPCIIILDYNMPELNGAEILDELRKKKRYDHIPKIIWSTSGSDTYKQKCLHLGASEYLTKPSSFQGLTEVARYMLSFC